MVLRWIARAPFKCLAGNVRCPSRHLLLVSPRFGAGAGVWQTRLDPAPLIRDHQRRHSAARAKADDAGLVNVSPPPPAGALAATAAGARGKRPACPADPARGVNPAALRAGMEA